MFQITKVIGTTLIMSLIENIAQLVIKHNKIEKKKKTEIL